MVVILVVLVITGSEMHVAPWIVSSTLIHCVTLSSSSSSSSRPSSSSSSSSQSLSERAKQCPTLLWTFFVTLFWDTFDTFLGPLMIIFDIRKYSTQWVFFCTWLYPAVNGSALVCHGLPWSASDWVVLNAQTFKWMDGIGSLNASLLRAPLCSAINYMTILTMMMFASTRIFDVELLTFPSFPNKLRPIQSIKDPIKYNILLWDGDTDNLPLFLTKCDHI